MIYSFIYRRCGDLPVGTCCRVMGVSTSGFYAWRACPVSDRDWGDAVLTSQILDIHRASRRSYARLDTVAFHGRQAQQHHEPGRAFASRTVQRSPVTAPKRFATPSPTRS
jgi:hypothetical protein